MKRCFKILFLLFGFLSGFELAALSLKEFDLYVEKIRKEQLVPGVAVAIVKGNQVVLAKGYGFLREGAQETVDENTIFQLASVSKAFTSCALGTQVDKELLSWDEEVISYLPQFALKEPYPTRFTTCRDLLAHRTGLPAFGADLLGKLGFSSEEILRRIRFIEPASSFRDKAHYSNVGFFVAGELLASVAKMSFEEAIKQEIFAPLKMKRSGFLENLQKTNVAFAHAQINDKIEVIPWDDVRGFPAAGGMTSTASDMGNWITMLLNEGVFEGKTLLKPATIKELFLPSMVAEISFAELPPIDEQAGFSFGLGWDSYHYKGKVIVEKGGALDGVRTVVTLIPEDQLGIVVLANLNMTVLPEIIRAKFLEMALNMPDEGMEKAILQKGTELTKLFAAPSKPKNALPLSNPLESYTGVFESALYGTVEIEQKEESLELLAGPAKWPGTLTHWSNNTFLLNWPTINSGREFVTFTLGPEGKAILLTTETLGVFSKL